MVRTSGRFWRLIVCCVFYFFVVVLFHCFFVFVVFVFVVIVCFCTCGPNCAQCCFCTCVANERAHSVVSVPVILMNVDTVLFLYLRS